MSDIEVFLDAMASLDGAMFGASSRSTPLGEIANAKVEHAWLQLWKRGLASSSRMVILSARQAEERIGHWPMLLHSLKGLGVVLEAISPHAIALRGMQLVGPSDAVGDVMVASIRSLMETSARAFDTLRISGFRDGDSALQAVRATVASNSKWDLKEEQVLVGARMLLRPGPDGGQLWPLTFRPAAKAASAAFLSGDLVLDAGDGVPTHILANLQKFFLLQGDAQTDRRNSERGVDPTIPLRALQGVSWESISEDSDAELALSAGTVQVPLLWWKSKPVAGAVVQMCDRTMRVHAMEFSPERPKQSLVWLLHWAMSQNAISQGMRSIEYAPQLLEEVGELRCERIFATRVSIRQRSVLRRIQRAMQATARHGTVGRSIERPGPSPRRGVYG